MIIQFGLHLDGMQPAPPDTAAGQAALGPARLLDMLGRRLALPQRRERPGEALLAYQSCLEDADTPRRFYHRSLAVDPLGVARTLLDWRARWYEAGWRGCFEGTVSRRLADLADVERLARERVPLTPGQRLERIARALDEGLKTQIARIVLHDDLDALPATWRDVLRRFECEPASGAELRANAADGTDLHRIQTTLLTLDRDAQHAGSDDVARIELAGDTSFVVVRGVSRDLSAQAIGEYVRKLDRPDETVVLAERDGIIVDNALERVGLPRAGFQHYSRFRAVTQVLKLGLSAVWKPVSPQLLLQFLLHPVGPLPGTARAALADAVAQEPGIGGHAWRDAVRTIAERESRIAERESQIAERESKLAERESKLAERESQKRPVKEPVNEPTAEAQRRVDRLLADIRYWLESERYPSSEGAPVAVLIERTQRVATWLTRRLHGTSGAEADLFGAAEAQCEALIDALDKLAERGTTHVARLVLERLVDEVTSAAADPSTFAHAGHVRAATAPGAVTQPWRTVIWWDLAPQPARVAYPWSDAELGELARQHVELPSSDALIRARSREWLRPILNARTQLILVVHDREEGHHPLWSRLTSVAERFTEVRIEQQLLGERAGAIPAIDVATEPLEVTPLPAPRRWWHLPPDARVPHRDAESYSSLTKLVYHPHQWVLRYAARLAPGRASNLATGSLLYGKLAHRLFESYFTAGPGQATSDTRAHDGLEVRHWLAETLPTIIEQEGAVLDEPGMGVTRERVVTTLEDALFALLRHLRQADIVSVRAEVWHDVPFEAARAAPHEAPFDTPHEAPFDATAEEARKARPGTVGTTDVGDAASGTVGGSAVGTLCGAIDLLLTDARGREVVLDVKWSGQEWRGREIAENRALQLATYAYMRRTHRAAGGEALPRWPEQAYFIVTTGDIVARDTSVFPEAVAFPPAEPESVEQVWRRLGQSYAWRSAQLAKGDIEVNAVGTEPDACSVPPEDALASEAAEPDNFDDFKLLTGWERGE